MIMLSAHSHRFGGFAPREVVTTYSGESLAKLNLSGAVGHNEARRRSWAVQEHRANIATEVWADFLEGRLDPDLMREMFNFSAEYRWNEITRKYKGLFAETMTTSDFSALSDQVLSRSVMANYALYPTTYQLIAKVNNRVRDFRYERVYAFDGGKADFGVVKELEGFDRRGMSQAYYDITIQKYEAGYALSWESIINDNLGMFQEMPRNIVIGGNNTIEKFATSLYIGAAGPDATYFSSGNANIITSNPAFTYESLQAAIAQWMTLKDADGVPINVAAGFTIVFGSADLYMQAMNIKKMLTADITNRGGTTNERLRTENWVGAMFTPIFNPWISTIATTNANTTWIMFANAAARPAMQINFLQGFDTIQLYRKAPNTMAMGGGVVDALGDFETMANEFKGITVFGGRMLDPKAAMASNGTGS